MIAKIKKFALDHSEEIVAASIIIAVEITVAAAGVSIGYKMAERRLELVGMDTWEDEVTGKINKIEFKQRNGKTVGYKRSV